VESYKDDTFLKDHEPAGLTQLDFEGRIVDFELEGRIVEFDSCGHCFLC